MLDQRRTFDTQLFSQFTGSGIGIALAFEHHAAGGHVPVTGIQRLAQGTAMHAEQAGAVEQQDVGAAPEQVPCAQLAAQHTAERTIVFVDPGDAFSIGGGAVRHLSSGPGHRSALRQQLTQVDQPGIGPRDVVGHHQRVVSQQAITAAVENHRTPQGFLRGL